MNKKISPIIMYFFAIAIITLALLIILYDFDSNRISFSLNDIKLQNLLLLLAFLAAAYYAYITNKMWQLNKEPVLRIQWHDVGRDKYYKELQIQKPVLYNTYTDLQLINDGNGSARNLIITVEDLHNKEISQLRNVTSIGPHGKTQLKHEEHIPINKSQVFNDEDRSYPEPFKITIDYEDVQKDKKQISFIVDGSYNDGFKII